MKILPNSLFAAATLALVASSVLAKLPVPSDEAKAKAAEAAAKTAWAGKIDGYKLCLAQDKVVAHYKKASDQKLAKAPVGAVSAAVGACTDPGPFVYMPVAPSAAASGVPLAVVGQPKKP